MYKEDSQIQLKKKSSLHIFNEIFVSWFSECRELASLNATSQCSAEMWNKSADNVLQLLLLHYVFENYWVIQLPLTFQNNNLINFILSSVHRWQRIYIYIILQLWKSRDLLLNISTLLSLSKLPIHFSRWSKI
jgi:hypothetical protein